MPEHHHFHEDNNFISVFLQGHKPKLDQVSEKLIILSSNSSEHLDALSGKFKWCLFEFQTLSWGVREEETIVNVHYMSLVVNHDILVVSIFDLKDILDQGIGRQTVAEVLLSFFESLALNLSAAVFHHKIV